MLSSCNYASSELQLFSSYLRRFSFPRDCCADERFRLIRADVVSYLPDLIGEIYRKFLRNSRLDSDGDESF